MATLYSRVELYKRLDDNTWNATSEVLTNSKDIQIVEGLGKIIDNFSFTINNADNNLFKTYYSGDGSTVTFTLRHYPIPTPITGSRRERVYVGTARKFYTSDYTINNTNGTITFTTAPASGTRNIRIEYPLLETNDLVKIYQWKDMTWASMNSTQQANALLIEGAIVNPTSNIEETGASIKVDGKSWMDTLFSSLILLDQVDKNPSEIAQAILTEQQRFNPNRKVYWHGSNPSLKSDGNAFPDTTYVEVYKPAIECLEEISSDKYTHDGNYISYITVENGVRYLRWKPKGMTVSSTITEGTQPTSIKIGRPQDEIINAVIFNSGKDCYNHGIYYIRYDVLSIGASGGKWKYVNIGKLAPQLIQQEFEADRTKWTTDSQGNRTENFPTSYTYTMQFKERDSNTGLSLGTVYTVANDAEFNQAIRTEAKWAGYERAGFLLDLWSNPRFKATVTLPRPTPQTYNKGDLINLNLNRFIFNNFVNPYKLRLKGITHKFWDTDLTLEEDEETATSEV